MHNMKQVLYSVTVQCKEEHNAINGGSYYLHVVEVIAYFQKPLVLPPKKAKNQQLMDNRISRPH